MFSRRRFLPLFALAAFALLAACGNTEKKPVEFKTVEDRFPIKVGGQVVQMQLAILPAEEQKGLMFRKSMGADEGMIFLYDRPQQMSYWMRKTKTPVAVVVTDNVLPRDEFKIEKVDRRRTKVDDAP